MEAELVTEEDAFRDDGLDPIGEWMRSIGFCSACWIDHQAAEWELGMGLQAHHLVKRSKTRCDNTWNLLCLCERCHRLAEGHTIRVADGPLKGTALPNLTLAHGLWFKRDTEPYNYRPELMEPLYHQTLPEPESPPEFLVIERHRRRPIVPWRELMQSHVQSPIAT